MRLAEGACGHLILATDPWMDGYDGFFFVGLGKNRGVMRLSMTDD
jgi:hypothetical protein